MELRVAVVAFDRLATRDGISRCISSISAYFQQRAIILTDRYRRDRTHTISDKTRVYQIGAAHWYDAFLPVVVALNRSFRIKAIAEESAAAILNAHGYKSLILSCVAKFLSNRRLKVSWLVYDESDISTFKGRLLVRLATSAKLVDQILVLSNRMKRIIETDCGITNVLVLRLGVSEELIRLSGKPSGNIAEPTALKRLIPRNLKPHTKLYFHGILIPRRRVEDILEALAILKRDPGAERAVLYVSGDPEFDARYVKKLRELIQKLDLAEDVVFLGSLDDDETIAFMYEFCDIFIFPCERQSWGLAPLEAMLFGKPVIITSDAGVAEVLAREKAAEIVPVRNPEKLAICIRNLMHTDELTESRARKRRGYVIKNLTYMSTGSQLEAFWRRLAAR